MRERSGFSIQHPARVTFPADGLVLYFYGCRQSRNSPNPRIDSRLMIAKHLVDKYAAAISHDRIA